MALTWQTCVAGGAEKEKKKKLEEYQNEDGAVNGLTTYANKLERAYKPKLWNLCRLFDSCVIFPFSNYYFRIKLQLQRQQLQPLG